MPGITGFTHNRDQNLSERLKASRKLLTYADWYVEDELFSDENIACSRTHLGLIGDANSPVRKEDIYAWVEGEFYNKSDLEKTFGFPKTTHAGLLIEAYRASKMEALLSKLDGYYCAVLYDSIKKQICLLSDRLGMKPLYYWQEDGVFAWSSELKGFLALPGFEPKIRPEAVDCFLDLGFLIGDVTWFENVHLLDAATILIFDLKSRKIIEKKRYWTWANIKPRKMDFREAVAELSDLLKKAVRKRHFPGTKEGITLSGGLDSRAIVVALGEKIPAVTYGRKGCEDIRIAKKVTELAGLPHHILDLNENNWLDKRLDAVWKTDAMCALTHLHFGMHHEGTKVLFDVNWNGFLGEIALGGALIKRPNRRISKKAVEKAFGKQVDLINVEDPFYDIETEDVFWIDSRSRRFINAGSMEFSKFVEQRKPFLDNELLEFVYSLPDDFRRHSQLYVRALMRLSPPPSPLKGESTRSKKIEGNGTIWSIPWQRTGIPPGDFRMIKFFKKYKIPQILDRLGLTPNRIYTDYPNWMRTEKAAKLFGDLLRPEKALYPNFTNEDFQKKYLELHLKRKANFAEQIGRAASLEYWLRCVFEPGNR